MNNALKVWVDGQELERQDLIAGNEEVQRRGRWTSQKGQIVKIFVTQMNAN